MSSEIKIKSRSTKIVGMTSLIVLAGAMIGLFMTLLYVK